MARHAIRPCRKRQKDRGHPGKSASLCKQLSDLQTLEAEVELAYSNKDRALELFSLADKAKRSGMTIEAVAHAYEASGNTEQTIVWYELFLGSAGTSLGWAAQQDWLVAHYYLARIYF
jgi:hypothetical protein